MKTDGTFIFPSAHVENSKQTITLPAFSLDYGNYTALARVSKHPCTPEACVLLVFLLFFYFLEIQMDFYKSKTTKTMNLLYKNHQLLAIMLAAQICRQLLPCLPEALTPFFFR